MAEDARRQTLEELIANRRTKLERLRELGVDPYPTRARVEDPISGVVGTFGDRTGDSLEEEAPRTRVAGRVTAIRGHGKAAFIDVSDGVSRLQAHLKKNRLSETDWNVFNALDLGDFVRVEGVLFRTRTGELTVGVEQIRVLAKALRPLPEKYHGLADLESRARQRYLDLATNPESRRVFEVRTAAISAIRRFLENRGFLEVETPMMQPIPGGATARPFATHHNALDLELFLRIAPELYLKQLLVGGFEQVFEINRNFRNEGISTRHNPEFTMLELYWAYADYEMMMELTEAIAVAAADGAVGGLRVPWGDTEIDLQRPWRRMTLREAILAHSDLREEDLGERRSMEKAARNLDVERIEERSDGALLAELFEVTAEARLIQPTFILDFPRDISPLAKSRPDDSDVVERFELFIGGMEIANAYTELNDPIEQRKRFEAQAAEGERIDEAFLTALEHGMPPAAGLGIGIDRLVMLLTNRRSIRDVILFPLLRPKDEA